mgnify:CR=1 FL=1
MAKILLKEEYDKYFRRKDNIYVENIAQLSIVSNRLTVIDYSEADMIGGEYTPYYTQAIENGEYNVKVSLIDYGTGGYCVAAVKVEFTDEYPVNFEMALYENQDISKLHEDYFYGFAIDSGMAIIADSEVLNEYYEILEEFDENEDVISPAIEYYMANIENEFADSYKKFPEYKISYVDYVVPQTSHHMLFIETGMGDGTYPVYFGFSNAGNLCCAVVQFIFNI